jgi:hypothetical protein
MEKHVLRSLLRFLLRHPANVGRQADFRYHFPVQSIPPSGLRAENLLGSPELTEVLSPNCPIPIRMYPSAILSTDFFDSEQVTSPIHPVFFLFLEDLSFL